MRPVSNTAGVEREGVPTSPKKARQLVVLTRHTPLGERIYTYSHRTATRAHVLPSVFPLLCLGHRRTRFYCSSNNYAKCRPTKKAGAVGLDGKDRGGGVKSTSDDDERAL